MDNFAQKREFHLQPIESEVKRSETEPATPEPMSKKRKRTSVSKTPTRENGTTSVESTPSSRKTSRLATEEHASDMGGAGDIVPSTTLRRSTRTASRAHYAEENDNVDDEFEGDDDALMEVAAEYDQTVVKDEQIDEDEGEFVMEGLESMEQDEVEDEEDLDEKKDFKPVMKLSYTGQFHPPFLPIKPVY
jgi:hypothetical protein